MNRKSITINLLTSGTLLWIFADQVGLIQIESQSNPLLCKQLRMKTPLAFKAMDRVFIGGISMVGIILIVCLWRKNNLESYFLIAAMGLKRKKIGEK